MLECTMRRISLRCAVLQDATAAPRQSATESNWQGRGCLWTPRPLCGFLILGVGGRQISARHGFMNSMPKGPAQKSSNDDDSAF